MMPGQRMRPRVPAEKVAKVGVRMGAPFTVTAVMACVHQGTVAGGRGERACTWFRDCLLAGEWVLDSKGGVGEWVLESKYGADFKGYWVAMTP